MIEINLLPLRELLQRKRRFRALLVTGIVLALTSILLGYHHSIRSKDVARLVDELSVSQRNRPALLAGAQKVEALRSEIEKRQRKIQALGRASRSRTILSQLLKMLSEAVPERLWLTSLAASNENFNVEGIAPDHRTIADFLGNLSMSPKVNHLELIEASSIENSGTGPKSFKIQGRLARGPFSGRSDAAIP